MMTTADKDNPAHREAALRLLIAIRNSYPRTGEWLTVDDILAHATVDESGLGLAVRGVRCYAKVYE